jgi:ankyrin repeat protein
MFATPETAEMLIKNGADVNLANCFGYTPLRFFREHGNEKIVAILEKSESPDTDDIKTDNFSGNSQTSPAFTIEEIEEIRNLAKDGKIEAIKRVRQLKGWDLKECNRIM